MAESLPPPLSVPLLSSDEGVTGRRSPSPSGPTLLDYSFTGIQKAELEEALANQPTKVFSSVETVLGTNLGLDVLPEALGAYSSLKHLDLSFNQLTIIPEALTQCQNLVTLVLKNNLIQDGGFPKELTPLSQLKELNLSGNALTRFPETLLHLSSSLVTLHLGANQISGLPREIAQLSKLQVLYLGGNQLTELPSEVGYLTQLKVFVLCENRLETLPSTVSNLKHLKSLLLHRNRITALPVELIKLRNLMELSLRDNPLVGRFVRDLVYNPPSLMELAGRAIKIKKVEYSEDDLPENLLHYLNCAHECVNPRCKGVYFDTCVEHIKFVDFCGKYRIPLLQYLCSPKCSDHQSPAYEASDSDSDDDRMRKVLLG